MEKKKSAISQFGILVKEYFNLIMSDKKNLIVTLLFPVVAAIITVWVAGENMFVHYDGTKSASFILVSAAIWGGLFNSIQVVVKERANIKRDFINGIRPRCYTASRAVLQFVICVVQSLILTVSFLGVSWKYGNELPESGIIFGNVLIEYFISLLLLMYAADMMGFMISCIVKSAETANVMAPYILIVQLIFSGILFQMKGFADKFSYLMISRWGMEALGSSSNLNDMKLKIQLTVPAVPHEAEDMFLSTQEHLLVIWAVFLAFIMVFVIAGNLLLHRVSKDSR